MILYWLIKRAWYRHLWKQRRINVGQFFKAMDGLPFWLDRGTQTVLSKISWKIYRWKHETQR